MARVFNGCKSITSAEGSFLLRQYIDDGYRTPRCMFYFYDWNVDRWIAIDNVKGDFIMEEFENIEDCSKWLDGREVLHNEDL